MVQVLNITHGRWLHFGFRNHSCVCEIYIRYVLCKVSVRSCQLKLVGLLLNWVGLLAGIVTKLLIACTFV